MQHMEKQATVGDSMRVLEEGGADCGALSWLRLTPPAPRRWLSHDTRKFILVFMAGRYNVQLASKPIVILVDVIQPVVIILNHIY